MLFSSHSEEWAPKYCHLVEGEAAGVGLEGTEPGAPLGRATHFECLRDRISALCLVFFYVRFRAGRQGLCEAGPDMHGSHGPPWDGAPGSPL